MFGVGELQVQVFYTAVGASHHSNILFKSKIFFLMIVEKELMVTMSVLVLIVCSDFQLVVLLSTSCQLLVSTAGGLVERVVVRLAEWARWGHHEEAVRAPSPRARGAGGAVPEVTSVWGGRHLILGLCHTLPSLYTALLKVYLRVMSSGWGDHTLPNLLLATRAISTASTWPNQAHDRVKDVMLSQRGLIKILLMDTARPFEQLI